MTKENDILKIANEQPIPAALKNNLPINYFLFVKRREMNVSEGKLAKSKFHNTNQYNIYGFYKSISNIL